MVLVDYSENICQYVGYTCTSCCPAPSTLFISKLWPNPITYQVLLSSLEKRFWWSITYTCMWFIHVDTVQFLFETCTLATFFLNRKKDIGQSHKNLRHAKQPMSTPTPSDMHVRSQNKWEKLVRSIISCKSTLNQKNRSQRLHKIFIPVIKWCREKSCQ